MGAGRRRIVPSLAALEASEVRCLFRCVPFPYAAWGTMIGATSGAAGKDILENYPNLWVPAGVCIILAVLAFNFVGDGLRDAFDPKAKR